MSQNILDLCGIIVGTSLKTATIIDPDLAVGSYYFVDRFVASGWRCLLLAVSASRGYPDQQAFYWPILDVQGNNAQRVAVAIRWVLLQWRRGERVAVLCRSGAIRAPGIAACAQVAAGRRRSVEGAILEMSLRRDKVQRYGDVTAEFERALKEHILACKS